MITVCTWLFWAVTYVFNIGQSTLPKLLVFWAAAVVFVVTGRAIARAICRRRINYLQNTIIVGAGEVGQLIAKKVLHHPEYGINLVGFVDADPRELSGAARAHRDARWAGAAPTLIRLFDVERVIIAFSLATNDDMLDLIRSLKDYDVHVDIVPRYFELVGSEVGIHAVEGISLVGLPPMRLSKSSRLLKLVLDVALAGTALVLLSRCSSSSRSGSSSTHGARCSSGRCGWGPEAGRSASTSSGRCTPTPNCGSSTSST